MVRGVVPPRLRAAQAGISLVETLVALVLGLAMVSVAFNLYVSNRGVFRQIEAMVRLQESASVAAALLETSIRHAGGTLCRNNPPTTILLDVLGESVSYEYEPPYAFWEESDADSTAQIGLKGYESTTTDMIVGEDRKAGDSISIMSDNMGAVARVTGRATHASSNSGLTGTYTFPVDNGLEFPVGTVAMACDHVRAVLFQVTDSTTSTIKLQAGTGAPTLTPGNCSVAMRRARLNAQSPNFVDVLDNQHSCTTDLTNVYGGQRGRVQMYTFGPGSMIGEHTFEHWYIGKKTSTDACCSLRRLRATYSATGVGSKDEEIVEDVTDMQITYLRGLLYTGYPSSDRYFTALEIKDTQTQGLAPPWRQVTAVRIVLTLTSPEKVGLAAANAASAATYTIPTNVAIRARMPGVVRR